MRFWITKTFRNSRDSIEEFTVQNAIEKKCFENEVLNFLVFKTKKFKKRCAHLQGAEAKLGIFSYNHKQFNYKTRLILVFKNKSQNKKTDTKQ